MTRVRLLGTGQHLALSSGSNRAPVAPPVAPPVRSGLVDDPHQLMERFIDLFYRRRQVRAAFESCVVRTGFRDHDPSRPGGRQAAIEMLARKLAEPDFFVEVERVFLDGDRAVVHTWVGSGTDRHQRLDLFRIDAGRIVEHWGFDETGRSAFAHALPTETA